MRCLTFFFCAGALYAQPQFEAASMKLVPAGEPARQRVSDSSQLHYPSVNLLNLVREAFRLASREQVAGPPWMATQLYRIDASFAPNSSSQIPEMLQTLLAARLKLSVHHETRLLPANILLPAKSGIRPLKMHPAAQPDEQLELDLNVPLVHLSGRGTLAQLIDQLNHGIGGRNRWVDRTGLAGFFEFKLDFALELPSNSPLAESPELIGVPQLAEAIERQLGFRVETSKAPADIVVIDSVERVPAGN